jgi:hypothetical protein
MGMKTFLSLGLGLLLSSLPLATPPAHAGSATSCFLSEQFPGDWASVDVGNMPSSGSRPRQDGGVAAGFELCAIGGSFNLAVQDAYHGVLRREQTNGFNVTIRLDSIGRGKTALVARADVDATTAAQVRLIAEPVSSAANTVVLKTEVRDDPATVAVPAGISRIVSLPVELRISRLNNGTTMRTQYLGLNNTWITLADVTVTGTALSSETMYVGPAVVSNSGKVAGAKWGPAAL